MVSIRLVWIMVFGLLPTVGILDDFVRVGRLSLFLFFTGNRQAIDVCFI